MHVVGRLMRCIEVEFPVQKKGLGLQMVDDGDGLVLYGVL